MSDREQWPPQSGFILATFGSAVGLGNIWRFSYIAGENGGGAFLVLYLIYVVLIGLPLMIAELALGRAISKHTVKCPPSDTWLREILRRLPSGRIP